MNSYTVPPSGNAELLRHLPMTELETQLQRTKMMNLSNYSRVLSPAEMAQYVAWLSEKYGSKEEYGFSFNDFSMLSGGSIAKIGSGMLEVEGRQEAVEQLSALYTGSAETLYFSNHQSVSAGRILRHFPAYWQTSECFEILYVFSGTCPVWFENEQIVLTPGSVLLIPPNTPRACNCPEDDCVMLFFMIRASTFSRIFWEQLSNQNLMSLFFRQALSREGRTEYLRFETGRDASLEAVLISILRQYNSRAPYSAQMTNALMGTFFLYLLQNYEQTALLPASSRFPWKPEYAALFRYIQDHYQTVTMDELAEEFSYSQRQIIRIIRSSTGKTFTQLVTQLRMENAAAMVLSGQKSLEQIAAEVGYASLSSFYRVFVKYYEMTPGQWRNAQAGE